MLVEIHMLQNHSPSNPNRDDLGAPKTALFGGRLRARISSQCLKRSIRWSPLLREALGNYIGLRTVGFPKLVAEALAPSSIPKEEHAKIVATCASIAKAERNRKTAADEETEPTGNGEEPRTAQLIFLGPTEVRDFVTRLERLRTSMPADYKQFLEGPSAEEAEAAAKSAKGKKGKTARKGPSKEFWHDLRQAYQHNAVDIALFGRMTTSDAFEDVEAAMAVAHALSTTELAHNEVDYFTAVDDMPRGPGAPYIEEGQFNSSTFYKYFSLDWDALVANLAGPKPSDERLKGARCLATKALVAFLEAAACTVPSGKRNSFANSNLPDGILVETKPKKVATNYANAFLVPARPFTDRDGEHDVVEDSIRKLAHYVDRVAGGYGLEAKRWWFSTRDKVPFATSQKVPVTTVATLRELTQAVVQSLA